MKFCWWYCVHSCIHYYFGLIHSSNILNNAFLYFEIEWLKWTWILSLIIYIGRQLLAKQPIFCANAWFTSYNRDPMLIENVCLYLLDVVSNILSSRGNREINFVWIRRLFISSMTQSFATREHIWFNSYAIQISNSTWP